MTDYELQKTVHGFQSIEEPFTGMTRQRGRAAGIGSLGLDIGLRPDRINPLKRCMQTACDHNRTQIIARRDGVDYVECLDCRQIFEAEDLEPVKVEEDEE